jgi:hypothetical protein
MEDTTTNLVDMILKSLETFIILVSALWAYFRFKKEDPLYPRIEFDISCNVFGPQQDSYLTSFTVTANNKGYVEHKFSEIHLRVLGIKASEPLMEFQKFPPMVSFPEKILKEINIVPPHYEYYFVRPGVNQEFNFATQIPVNIRFILVRATFIYQSTKEIHSTEKVFEVKA